MNEVKVQNQLWPFNYNCVKQIKLNKGVLYYTIYLDNLCLIMESSTYGTSHLPSPALVVFSQAAGGLGEALRIQRPFHSQVNLSCARKMFDNWQIWLDLKCWISIHMFWASFVHFRNTIWTAVIRYVWYEIRNNQYQYDETVNIRSK